MSIARGERRHRAEGSAVAPSCAAAAAPRSSPVASSAGRHRAPGSAASSSWSAASAGSPVSTACARAARAGGPPLAEVHDPRREPVGVQARAAATFTGGCEQVRRRALGQAAPTARLSATSPSGGRRRAPDRARGRAAPARARPGPAPSRARRGRAARRPARSRRPAAARLRSRSGTSSSSARWSTISALGRERPVSTKLRCRVETPASSARSSWLRRRRSRQSRSRSPTGAEGMRRSVATASPRALP